MTLIRAENGGHFDLGYRFVLVTGGGKFAQLPQIHFGKCAKQHAIYLAIHCFIGIVVLVFHEQEIAVLVCDYLAASKSFFSILPRAVGRR